MAYNYYYTMDYLPTRYQADSNEWEIRRAVWNFKDGNCSTSILIMLKRYVNRIIGSDSTDEYVICFIPASTRAKTLNRFADVAEELESRTGVEATLEAITKPIDSASGHLTGKSSNPTAGFLFHPEYFKGKKVILIDDVITRGTTFNDTAAKLSRYGAKSVTGLFVAKTVYMNSYRNWA
jgi:predicted amidophosphoribosyltransferase